MERPLITGAAGIGASMQRTHPSKSTRQWQLKMVSGGTSRSFSMENGMVSRLLQLFAEQVIAAENCALFPTVSALLRTPQVFAEATSCVLGSAYLSLLTPGTHLAAHCGPTNARLRMHLGLVVPQVSR